MTKINTPKTTPHMIAVRMAAPCFDTFRATETKINATEQRKSDEALESNQREQNTTEQN